MKRPNIDDKEINDYIDSLITENDDLKIELFELKNKRTLEFEYKELISEILSAINTIYDKHKEDENDISSDMFQVKTYIKTFLEDYKIIL